MANPANPSINIKNLNWLRSANTIDRPHLVAACFDDVSAAYGQLAGQLTDTQSQLAAALARIAALEGK